VADLKAEKVHLQSLANEKGHSDKLRKRLDAMKKTISEKETECEESKREYDAMVESNRKFYELYNKFREMYVKVDQLEKSKEDTFGTLRQVKAKYRELPGKWHSFTRVSFVTFDSLRRYAARVGG
jgi:DNA repair protein RAD50